MGLTTERFDRWVRASEGLALIHEYFAITAQGLGRLDTKLVAEMPRFIDISNQHLTIDSLDHEPTAFFNDHILFSYLWVLGAYELVRSVDQRCRENKALSNSEFGKAINSTKLEFERIRVPLAKVEPAKRHSATDRAIAWPAVHKEFGAGWRINEDDNVSRLHLADTLLSTLEILKRLER